MRLVPMQSVTGLYHAVECFLGVWLLIAVHTTKEAHISDGGVAF
jgi:hypothetical protein